MGIYNFNKKEKVMRKKLLTIIAAAAVTVSMIPVSASAANNIVLPDEMKGEWGGNETTSVYYNDNNVETNDYYNTLADALKGVYMSNPSDTVAIYCKPGADVGTMTHGHVEDSMIIYGNGAFVSGGEHDLEIDTYKYDRSTGTQLSDTAEGNYLTKDITIDVINLNGIAAWGQRHTENTVNLKFKNCNNMNRVYITGATGANNISLDNCSFDSEGGSHNNTSIYSNASGTIEVNATAFKGIAIPVNLNNKSTGVQKVIINACSFTDCSTPELANVTTSTNYAAPVRIVAQKDATTNLFVIDSNFEYTADKSKNGDILLGDGRNNTAADGTITLKTEGTAAEIQQQKAGFYNDNGTTNPDKMITTAVEKTEIATVDESGNIIVKGNEETDEPTTEIPSTGTPSGSENNQEQSPETGDNGMTIPFATAGLALAAVTAAITLRKRHAR